MVVNAKLLVPTVFHYCASSTQAMTPQEHFVVVANNQKQQQKMQIV